MAVKAYYHTDTGAPTLNGQTGSLIALLKACLVDGYGTKTSLGWSMMQTAGVNKAAFRMQTSGATGSHLYVDDTGPGALGGREARGRGYTTIESLDASGNPVDATNPFPTAAQSAAGTIWAKSSTADATARAWTLVGDERALFLCVIATAGAAPDIYHFGDLVEGGASKYALISARVSENSGDNSFSSIMATHNGTSDGKYISNSVGGVGGSQAWGTTGAYLGASAGVNGWAFPNPEDMSLHFVAMGAQIAASNGTYMGRLPGCHQPLHPRPLAHLGTVDLIAGPLAGRTLVGLQCFSWGGGAWSEVLIDVTGPWR